MVEWAMNMKLLFEALTCSSLGNFVYMFEQVTSPMSLFILDSKRRLVSLVSCLPYESESPYKDSFSFIIS